MVGEMDLRVGEWVGTQIGGWMKGKTRWEGWVGEVMSGCVGWCVDSCMGRVCEWLGGWVSKEVFGVFG